MRTIRCLSLFAVALLLAGCNSSRSISNSSYRETDHRCWAWDSGSTASDAAFAYRGELSEFDVLAVRPHDGAVTDEEIRRTLEEAQPLRLKPGSAVLLVQSGALFPDGPMVKELSRHFTVVPFSGVPPERSKVGVVEDAAYASSLRLAAARAGAETVLCYWGVLESAREDLATKTISWVPILGRFVPDERQQIRIRLKLALIDVRSGRWSVLSPEPFDRKGLSARVRRGSSDQKQVEWLKETAYATGVRELVERHMN